MHKWLHIKILPISRKFCVFLFNFFLNEGENKLTTTKTKKKKKRRQQNGKVQFP